MLQLLRCDASFSDSSIIRLCLVFGPLCRYRITSAVYTATLRLSVYSEKVNSVNQRPWFDWQAYSRDFGREMDNRLQMRREMLSVDPSPVALAHRASAPPPLICSSMKVITSLQVQLRWVPWCVLPYCSGCRIVYIFSDESTLYDHVPTLQLQSAPSAGHRDEHWVMLSILIAFIKRCANVKLI